MILLMYPYSRLLVVGAGGYEYSVEGKGMIVRKMNEADKKIGTTSTPGINGAKETLEVVNSAGAGANTKVITPGIIRTNETVHADEANNVGIKETDKYYYWSAQT